MKKGFAVALFIVLVVLVLYVFGNHYQNQIMVALGILAVLSIITIGFSMHYSKIDSGGGRILGIFGLLNLFIIYVILNSFNAHSKGYIGGLKASLANARAQAILVNDQVTPRSFADICNDESIKKLLNTDYVKIHKCFGGQNNFVITAETNATKFKRNYPSKRSDVYVCVDLNNFKEITGEQYAAITSADTLCP